MLSQHQHSQQQLFSISLASAARWAARPRAMGRRTTPRSGLASKLRHGQCAGIGGSDVQVQPIDHGLSAAWLLRTS